MLKRYVPHLAACLLAVGVTGVSYGGAFAPAVTIPADGGGLLPWQADAIRQMQIPPADVVGIPAYPGARVVQVMAGGEMTMNDETHRYNPSIKLLTTDTEEAVAEFYRDALDGWSSDRVMGMTWFWQGEDDFNPLDVEAVGLIPAIGIMPPGPLGRAMPDAQVMIEIRYSPAD